MHLGISARNYMYLRYYFPKAIMISDIQVNCKYPWWNLLRTECTFYAESILFHFWLTRLSVGLNQQLAHLWGFLSKVSYHFLRWHSCRLLNMSKFLNVELQHFVPFVAESRFNWRYFMTRLFVLWSTELPVSTDVLGHSCHQAAPPVTL